MMRPKNWCNSHKNRRNSAKYDSPTSTLNLNLRRKIEPFLVGLVSKASQNFFGSQRNFQQKKFTAPLIPNLLSDDASLQKYSHQKIVKIFTKVGGNRPKYEYDIA